MTDRESSTPVPDWYEDPESPGQLRYWDGTNWTEHRHTPDAGGDKSGSMAAGWYPDPEVPWRDRYFDGASWTEDLRADPEAPPHIPSSTTAELPGMVIVENLGVVWATSVRAHIREQDAVRQFKAIGRALKPSSPTGPRFSTSGAGERFEASEHGLATYMADQARHWLMVKLFRRVVALGGNAVVGVQFVLSRDIQSAGVTDTLESTAYGTAVIARAPQ